MLFRIRRTRAPAEASNTRRRHDTRSGTDSNTIRALHTSSSRDASPSQHCAALAMARSSGFRHRSHCPGTAHSMRSAGPPLSGARCEAVVGACEPRSALRAGRAPSKLFQRQRKSQGTGLARPAGTARTWKPSQLPALEPCRRPPPPRRQRAPCTAASLPRPRSPTRPPASLAPQAPRPLPQAQASRRSPRHPGGLFPQVSG